MKSTVDEIRQRFDADVERFSNLETGQSATADAPLGMELIGILGSQLDGLGQVRDCQVEDFLRLLRPAVVPEAKGPLAMCLSQPPPVGKVARELGGQLLEDSDGAAIEFLDRLRLL